MTKIAVSLPVEQVAAAREAVARGEAASVSAFVAQAIADREVRTALQDVVAGLVAELGAPSDSDYAWAERVLGSSRERSTSPS